MKCQYCESKLYVVKMDYRDGNKTTKEPIGRLCPVCDYSLLKEPTQFWNSFHKKKEQEKRNIDNERSYSAKSPKFGRVIVQICAKCRSTKYLKVRKIPMTEKRRKAGETPSWRYFCTKCQIEWTANTPARYRIVGYQMIFPK